MATNQDILFKIVGDNIKKRRQLKKINQSLLASSINLSRTSLVNIEQGRQHPSLYLLLQIAQQLDTSLHDIIPNNNHVDTKKNQIPDNLKASSFNKIYDFVEDFSK